MVPTAEPKNQVDIRFWHVTLRLALAWRRDNTSPLLASFIGEVRRSPKVRAVNKR
jgi:hypothetical protein